jgi:K+-transporting ATPase ATPase C chain
VLRQLFVNLVLIVTTLAVGVVAYPALLLAVAVALAPAARSGSLVVEGDRVLGSSLVAQDFTDAGYFRPRPSASKYDAGNTSGSNLGASNPALRERAIRQLASLARYRSGKLVAPDVAPDEDGFVATFEAWLRAHPEADLERVPGDLVTASGSGLDPHVTLAGARYQLPRVAATWAQRLGRPEAEVRAKLDALLVAEAGRPLGFLGEPLVNVLEVNRKLAAALKND